MNSNYVKVTKYNLESVVSGSAWRRSPNNDILLSQNDHIILYIAIEHIDHLYMTI